MAQIGAFGTLIPMQADTPYASGFLWTPGDGPKTFSTSRALKVTPASDNTDNVYVMMNDAQGQMIPLDGFASNPLVPVAITAISGGDIQSAVVLY